MKAKEISKRAQRVYNEAMVIDMEEAAELGGKEWSSRERRYFKVARDAGITAIGLAVPCVSDDLPATIKEIAKFYEGIEGIENAKLAFTASDIESAKEEGKIAIIAGIQDSIPFESDLGLLRIFERLGVRVIQIAYSKQNYLGAGSGERVAHGLTDRGREAVKELNRLGILINVSHCGDRTAMDIIQESGYPVALTHSTPRTLVDMPRAASDETIKAVAEKGGVIGQMIHTMFNEKKDKMGVRPTLNDFLDLIDYLVNLVGIDHVGFGFDLVPFSNQGDWDSSLSRHAAMYHPHKIPAFELKYVEGFNDLSDTTKITEELLKRRYSEDDTKKILGSNWLRLLKQVWK